MNPHYLLPVLEAAKRQSLLSPSAESNICFTDYLNSANYFLYLLSIAPEGLSTSQVVKRIGYSKVTCTCYLRTLTNLNFLERIDNGSKETIWYYKTK